MNYWLMKSEPNVWSIDQQKKAGIKGAALGWSKKLPGCKKFKINEKMVTNVFFITLI